MAGFLGVRRWVVVGFWESGDGFGEGYEVGVSIRPDGYARVLPLIPFNAMVVGTTRFAPRSVVASAVAGPTGTLK